MYFKFNILKLMQTKIKTRAKIGVDFRKKLRVENRNFFFETYITKMHSLSVHRIIE
jgi:hypothetical protein